MALWGTWGAATRGDWGAWADSAGQGASERLPKRPGGTPKAVADDGDEGRSSEGVASGGEGRCPRCEGGPQQRSQEERPTRQARVDL